VHPAEVLWLSLPFLWALKNSTGNGLRQVRFSSVYPCFSTVPDIADKHRPDMGNRALQTDATEEDKPG
jgi:hypothetical protein